MSQKPNTAADEALPEAMHDILKDLANECWREGHNEEPSNEVGYWVKEAASALKIQLQQAITDAERRGRLEDEKESLQVLEERDKAEDWADILANDIARLLGVEIGEHSNINEPWHNAHLKAAEALQANAGGGERE